MHYRDREREREMSTTSYRLNASNAIRGAYGMLHLDTADWNGQKPVVRTRTKRSTPFRLAYSKTNYSNVFTAVYCHHTMHDNNEKQCMHVTTGSYGYSNGLSCWWLGYEYDSHTVCHNSMRQASGSNCFQTNTSKPLERGTAWCWKVYLQMQCLSCFVHQLLYILYQHKHIWCNQEL